MKQAIDGGSAVLHAPLSRHETTANLAGLFWHDGVDQDRYAALEYARRMDQATTVEARRAAAAWLQDRLGVVQQVHADGSLGAMRSATQPAALAKRVRAAADL